MNFRLTLILSLLTLAFLPSCGEVEDRVSITNPSNSHFIGLAEIPLSDIKNNEYENYLVINEKGDTLASQLSHDNKLLFQVDIKAQSSQSFTLTKGGKHTYKAKVFGRHYPERRGDFAWENDRVGFRFYGKELKDVQAATSGLDLWYKRTDRMVLDDWYRKDLSKEASYHVDHGEGCDPYAVGQTLGGGSMAILLDSVLQLNENFNEFEVLDNGPLRVTFKLNYPTIVLNGQEVNETKTISLDVGSQLTKIVQEYTCDKEVMVATGFPKRAQGDSILYTKGQNYFVYQEPESKENGQIFLGIIIPEGIDDVFVNQKTMVNNSDKMLTTLPNIVATSKYQPNHPIVYYTGFGWTKYGFETLSSFEDYLSHFSASLSEPLRVTYMK